MNKKSLPIGQILLTRALNAVRPTYFPSYVGLRLIGSQMPSDNTGYLERMIVRRIRAGDSWRYRPFKLYKGTSIQQGEVAHVYRDCIAPSPSTAIAETVILAMFANDPAFAVSDRVYSYRWPKSQFAGGSYEYFAEGYKQRNLDVAHALRPGQIAVVTDIKGFYPSVSTDRALSVLKKRLTSRQSLLSESAEPILDFYRNLLMAGGNGIPIGPASAHVLGHLVLENVDQDLAKEFGNRYFRYVDDIVVVADSAERSRVEKTVEAVLLRHGFDLNTDKTVALPATAWQQSVIRPDVASLDSFRSFTADLTVYLAFHPDRADAIKSAFGERGLSVPISRLLAISRYSRFRYFIRRRKARDGLRHALSIWLSKNEDFLNRGKELKATYETALSALVAEPPEIEPSLRRWQVQRVRRVVNTLFYLRGFGEWKDGAEQLQEFPELVEQNALSLALYSGSVTPILPFYGRGPSAFSELWGEYGKSDPGFNWPKQGLNTAELESLIALQLHGTTTIAEHPFNFQDSESRLLGVALNNHPKRRSKPDLSYEDELESLRLSWSNEDLANLARTRYSLTESTALDALSLMSSEYRS